MDPEFSVLFHAELPPIFFIGFISICVSEMPFVSANHSFCGFCKIFIGFCIVTHLLWFVNYVQFVPSIPTTSVDFYQVLSCLQTNRTKFLILLLNVPTAYVGIPILPVEVYVRHGKRLVHLELDGNFSVLVDFESPPIFFIGFISICVSKVPFVVSDFSYNGFFNGIVVFFFTRKARVNYGGTYRKASRTTAPVHF